MKPLEVALADSIAPRRLTLALLGTFALSALLLAIVGVYGVVAYTVARRTQEIGVRIALGAPRRQVMAMVVRQGMAITLVGITAGLAGAIASTQLMTALLYEVTPTDFATFAAAVATVSVTALRCVLRAGGQGIPRRSTRRTSVRVIAPLTTRHYRPGFLRAGVVLSTNSSTSNAFAAGMSATMAYGSPSGYTAPICLDPCGSLNHAGAFRRLSANNGSFEAARMPSNVSGLAGGTVKFFKLPPP